jgi:hypothetical protein
MKREQIVQNTLVKQHALPLLEGAFAGLIATVPMTIFMLAAQRILPQGQPYALPPEKLTDKFAKRVGLRKHMDKPQLLIASFVSHLGFGAAAGAIYGPLTRIVPLPRPERYSFGNRCLVCKLSWMATNRRNVRSGHQAADPPQRAHDCCPCSVGSGDGSGDERYSPKGGRASVSSRVNTSSGIEVMIGDEDPFTHAALLLLAAAATGLVLAGGCMGR